MPAVKIKGTFTYYNPAFSDSQISLIKTNIERKYVKLFECYLNSFMMPMELFVVLYKAIATISGDLGTQFFNNRTGTNPCNEIDIINHIATYIRGVRIETPTKVNKKGSGWGEYEKTLSQMANELESPYIVHLFDDSDRKNRKSYAYSSNMVYVYNPQQTKPEIVYIIKNRK